MIAVANQPQLTADSRRSGWARFFFPPNFTTRLAVMRIICVAVELLFFSYTLQSHLVLLSSPGFARPQWLMTLVTLPLGEEAFRQAWVLTSLNTLTWVAGILALIGLFTRPALFVFAVCTMLEIAHAYSYNEFHHKETVWAMFLLMLAFAPSGDCLSVDAWLRQRRGVAAGVGQPLRRWTHGRWTDLAMWPLVAVQCLLALAYFDAAASKMIVGGLSWFNGYTLQNKLLTDGMRFDRPLGVWVSRYRELCILMALGAVAFEGLFWLILVPRLRRLVPVFLLGGAMLHVGIFIMQGAPFFHWMILYLTWLPWEKVPGLRPNVSEARDPTTARQIQ